MNKKNYMPAFLCNFLNQKRFQTGFERNLLTTFDHVRSSKEIPLKINYLTMMMFTKLSMD